VDVLKASMVPGRTFDSAARAAEQVMAPLASEVFFSGVFGYTVGAQFPPSWVEGSGFIARGESTVFQSGMEGGTLPTGVHPEAGGGERTARAVAGYPPVGLMQASTFYRIGQQFRVFSRTFEETT
jgi:hypothetical protein